jgi:hypothetical protein
MGLRSSLVRNKKSGTDLRNMKVGELFGISAAEYHADVCAGDSTVRRIRKQSGPDRLGMRGPPHKEQRRLNAGIS